jgi:HEAT repeat protein
VAAEDNAGKEAGAPSVVVLILLLFCCLSFSALAGVEQTVSDLIPKLAAAKVEDRYASQMELQALALKAGRPGAESERSELAKVLAAKAADATVPQPARVWIVRQLEYIGARESVATLTTLLSDPDPELKECARRALEKNAAPTASDSLRTALKRPGDTSWQIGLIQSLGERHDTGAVDLLKPFLQTKETAAATASARSAAAVALFTA